MGLKDLGNQSSTFGSSKSRNTLLTRERLIGLSLALLFLMSSLIFGLRWLERMITFHPVRYDPRQPWVTPAGAEDVWFSTADGVRLHSWFFHNHTKPSLATIIFFHGNGGNISNVGWVAEQLASSGFDVLLFDYRGYGRSDGEVEVLFAAANEPKKLIIFPGAGHNVFGSVGDKYLEIVAEFVRDAMKSRNR